MQQPPARPGQPGQPGGSMPMAMPMPFPLVQNINTLSELSGIPVHVLGNPAMQLAAQQLVAQRLVQQQLMSGQMRPMMPAQMLALQAQQAQLQQRMAAAAGGTAGAAAPRKTGGTGKKRGRPPASAAAMPAQQPVYAAVQPAARATNPYADPGGKVVWAKVGSYPWWPAKTLDPHRDLSFPPDADPPRPTSIPIRFFGTFEFQWIGSKRQLTDWEEGFDQFSRECDQSSFKAAMGEAQQYRETGRLPEVFYTTAEPEKPKAKARGKKRARTTADLAEHASAAAGGQAAALKARAAGRSAEQQEDRSLVVQRRKKQRLQELGLLPPDNSPYTGGRVAPNPNLLMMKADWEQRYADVVEEHRQQQEALTQRWAEAAAAKERAAAAAKQAAAVAAAAAAAAQTAAAGAAGTAASALLPPMLHSMPGQMQHQMQAGMLPPAFMQQLMSMQVAAGPAASGLPMLPKQQ